MTMFTARDRAYDFPADKHGDADTRTHTLQSMFDEALDDFKDRVGEKHFQDFRSTDINKLKKELNRVQQDQRKPKTLRNLRRIQGFLEAFEQFGTIIEVFVNASPYVCYVWGPVKFLLMVRPPSPIPHVQVITRFIPGIHKAQKLWGV